MVQAPQDSAPAGNLKHDQSRDQVTLDGSGSNIFFYKSRQTHVRLCTSAQCFEEGVDLFLPDSTGPFLPKQEVREKQVQSLYGNVLEATFLAASEVGVDV